MPNDCVMCGKTRFNFGDYDEGVEMWINETNDGDMARRSTRTVETTRTLRRRRLRSFGTGGQAMRATTDYVLNRKAIQHYLIDRDLTQGDFAKTLGISTSYFSELLNGRKSISLKILFSIAEETGIDIHELVIEVYE